MPGILYQGLMPSPRRTLLVRVDGCLVEGLLTGVGVETVDFVMIVSSKIVCEMLCCATQRK